MPYNSKLSRCISEMGFISNLLAVLVIKMLDKINKIAKSDIQKCKA